MSVSKARGKLLILIETPSIECDVINENDCSSNVTCLKITSMLVIGLKQ